MNDIYRSILHELGNKVSFLKSYLEAFPEKFNRDIVDAVSSIDVLTHYLLDLHSLEDRSRLEKFVERINIKDLIEDVYQELKVFSFINNVKVEIKGCEGIELKINKFLLRRVLFNLIHNAIKFSPKDSKVSITCSSDKGGRLELRMLNAVDRKKLIESKGTEIGLEITKNLIKLLGGYIKVELGKDPAEVVLTLIPHT